MTGFAERYIKSVFRTIEENRLVEEGDRIFAALSGGKDSSSMVYCLKKFVDEKDIECELRGFYINLDDSEEVMNPLEELMDMLDMDLIRIDPPDITRYKGSRPICSVCGAVKRYLMNKIPREMGANKLATGHNMDDFIVFFLKNLIGKNYSWISNFKPRVDSTHPKLLTRIRPLFNVGNKENERFCNEMNIPYARKHICRFKARECSYNRKRDNWYNVLYEIERWNRNFRRQMISAIEDLSTLFSREEEGRLNECSVCGEPTSGKICTYCRIFKNQQMTKNSLNQRMKH